MCHGLCIYTSHNDLLYECIFLQTLLMIIGNNLLDHIMKHDIISWNTVPLAPRSSSGLFNLQ